MPTACREQPNLRCCLSCIPVGMRCKPLTLPVLKYGQAMQTSTAAAAAAAAAVVSAASRDTLPAPALWSNETATVGATNACI
jgi:hypothetical protein